MAIVFGGGPGAWVAYDSERPELQVRGAIKGDVTDRLMELIAQAAQVECETAKAEKARQQVEDKHKAADIIRAVRLPYLQFWRACSHNIAGCDGANFKGYLSDRARIRKTLSRILKTERLVDTLTCYESETVAKQALLKIVRILLNAPSDPKDYFKQAASETELYREALASIDNAIAAARRRTIAPGRLLNGEPDDSCYTHLIAARDVLRQELQAFLVSRRPDVIQGHHIGTRGPDGGRRSVAARSLYELIPEAHSEPYAIISRLMCSAGIPITPEDVRKLVSKQKSSH